MEMETEKVDYQKLMDSLNKTNAFANEVGLKVTCLERGHAEAVMEVLPCHLNPYKTIHGGVFYTVADVAGGAVAISYGRPVFTANSDFHFLVAGRNVKTLRGEGNVLKAGRQLLVVEVLIKDQDDTVLCKGTFTYMKVPDKRAGKGLVFEKLC